MRKLRHREVTRLGSVKTISPGRLAPETVFLTTTQYYFTFLRKNIKEVQVQVKGIGLSSAVGEAMWPGRKKGGMGWRIKQEGKRVPRESVLEG